MHDCICWCNDVFQYQHTCTISGVFYACFFLIWVQENVISFLLWKKNNAQEMKKDFEIFRLYAEKFVELFCKNHNDRR